MLNEEIQNKKKSEKNSVLLITKPGNVLLTSLTFQHGTLPIRCLKAKEDFWFTDTVFAQLQGISASVAAFGCAEYQLNSFAQTDGQSVVEIPFLNTPIKSNLNRRAARTVDRNILQELFYGSTSSLEVTVSL